MDYSIIVIAALSFALSGCSGQSIHFDRSGGFMGLDQALEIDEGGDVWLSDRGERRKLNPAPALIDQLWDELEAVNWSSVEPVLPAEGAADYFACELRIGLRSVGFPCDSPPEELASSVSTLIKITTERPLAEEN